MTDAAGSPLGHLLTLSDAAELLRLSAAEVLELVRSGELPAFRLGSLGQWRIEQSALETFIRDQYDEQRRLAQWNEAQSAEVTELFGARRARTRRP
ncbi:helix-turn-helix domain-containing protein [Microcella sp.]|uniref:helix-turn-helix domain-containing protein n=1 Tax=Microcella sp. TaxID=1913979 RepID=UPI00391BD797